ncbi:hypothetical protein BXO1_013640 [Xanthomonas oryzae pv. oryzae]|nr:hypothetical protein BXO1_013640 [Xanthomonas oryzae pv. oryzae]
MPPHSEQIVSRICGALFRGSLECPRRPQRIREAPSSHLSGWSRVHQALPGVIAPKSQDHRTLRAPYHGSHRSDFRISSAMSGAWPDRTTVLVHRSPRQLNES